MAKEDYQLTKELLDKQRHPEEVYHCVALL